jgi:Uma2 family endonuclease
MATTPAVLSLEEYLQTTYKPDCDFVDDHIEERNVGKFEHSRIQALLAAWFVGHERLWGFIVATEQRTRISATRVRIPDVCLIRAESPREEITETPQLLCIEILSPEDRLSRTTKVLDDFAAMGVQHLWIIDPRDRAGYIYQPGGKLQQVEDRMVIPETPIYLDLPSLFSALD